jgi:hypothetical protein
LGGICARHPLALLAASVFVADPLCALLVSGTSCLVITENRGGFRGSPMRLRN